VDAVSETGAQRANRITLEAIRIATAWPESRPSAPLPSRLARALEGENAKNGNPTTAAHVQAIADVAHALGVEEGRRIARLPHQLSGRGDQGWVEGFLPGFGGRGGPPSTRGAEVSDVPACVSSVKFKRKNPHWKLVNNPFPATLHPGSCMGLVVRYKAKERSPIASELVITSDDPAMPVKTLDAMAYTIWDECCCKEDCDDCRGKGCRKLRCKGICEGAADDCCVDEDDD
jgi:hypothetical protein